MTDAKQLAQIEFGIISGVGTVILLFLAFTLSYAQERIRDRCRIIKASKHKGKHVDWPIVFRSKWRFYFQHSPGVISCHQKQNFSAPVMVLITMNCKLAFSTPWFQRYAPCCLPYGALVIAVFLDHLHILLPCATFSLLKKILIFEDGGMCTAVLTDSDDHVLLSSPLKTLPTDIEANIKEEDESETGSNSEDSSDNSDCRESDIQMNYNNDNVQSSRFFHKMFSSISQWTASSYATTTTTKKAEPNNHCVIVDQCVCGLCDRPFQNRDNVCESNSPNCSHLFHHDCIASWICIQNCCPSCSEPFVVLNMSNSTQLASERVMHEDWEVESTSDVQLEARFCFWCVWNNACQIQIQFWCICEFRYFGLWTYVVSWKVCDHFLKS